MTLSSDRVRRGSGRLRLAPMAVVAVAMECTAAGAQQTDALRERLRDAANDSGFADSVQGLTGFAALPGVSTANFKVEESTDGVSDTEMSKFVIPLVHDFKEIRIVGGALHTELTLGYLKSDQTVDDLLPGTALQADIDSEFRVFSAIGGVGLAFQPGRHTTLRPIALLGYSRIEQKSRFSGPGATQLEDTADGILFNFQTDDLLYGGAVELSHKQALGQGIEFTGNIRYNRLFVDTFAASDDVLKTHDNLGVFTGYVQLDGPTGVAALGRDLRWIWFVANSSFPGDSADSLGFGYFFEFGGGIKLVDRTVLDAIEGFSIRGSALAGNGVKGWSVGAKLDF